jgi:hypothetical protein
MDEDEATGADRRAQFAYVLLGMFVVFAFVGGALVGSGVGAGWGAVGGSLACLVAAYLLGQGED